MSNKTTVTGDDLLDQLSIEPSEATSKQPILARWGLTEAQFTEIVDSNPSLRGVALGYVAEWQFHQRFLHNPAIQGAHKADDHNRKRKGDRTFTYKGHSFIVEVKSLQTAMVKRLAEDQWFGKTQVDASDKREVKFKDGTSLSTTCLLRGEFDVLAINCYAFGDQWRFVFIKNADLPLNTFKKYTPAQQAALLPTLIPVAWPPSKPYSTELVEILDDLVREREAGLVPEVPVVPASVTGTT